MTAARLLRHETILALLTIVALAVLASMSDKFFTAENLLNQGRLMAEVGLVALAFVQLMEFVAERHVGWRINRQEFLTDLFYVLLGITATPFRGDNRDLLALCDGTSPTRSGCSRRSRSAGWSRSATAASPTSWPTPTTC